MDCDGLGGPSDSTRTLLRGGERGGSASAFWPSLSFTCPSNRRISATEQTEAKCCAQLFSSLFFFLFFLWRRIERNRFVTAMAWVPEARCQSVCPHQSRHQQVDSGGSEWVWSESVAEVVLDCSEVEAVQTGSAEQTLPEVWERKRVLAKTAAVAAAGALEWVAEWVLQSLFVL